MQIMSHFYGEEGFVPYGTKHISNMCTGLRSKTQENDMHETLNYFSKIHEEEDPGLFVRVKMDNEEHTQNLVWVDGAAKKAYAAAYSDCVSFDTTFMTNCYNMPFAPFIGINRHGYAFHAWLWVPKGREGDCL